MAHITIGITASERPLTWEVPKDFWKTCVRTRFEYYEMGSLEKKTTYNYYWAE